MIINTLKDQKGITLIILVTIIILLLILAGISVTMISGNNGVIKNAIKARSDNTVGEDIEQIRASFSAVKMDKMKKGDGKEHIVTADDLKKQLIADLHLDDDTKIAVRDVTREEIDSTQAEEGDLRVTMSSKNIYLVDKNGKTTLLSESK